MPAFLTLDDIDVAGKAALTRVDLNVPMQNGQISDVTRIAKVLPTIRELAQRGAKVILLAHLGRPKGRDPEQSLRPVATALTELLPGVTARFCDDCIGKTAEQAVADLPAGGVLLLENVRFYPEEEKNTLGFVRQLAALGDLYVNDAFSAAHRAHASTEGLSHLLPAVAGRLMQAELEALDQALGAPERPVMALVGGAKVSTKLDLLNNLVTRVDALAIGGGMANTFLYALGKDVGKSLCEKDAVATVRGILAAADAAGCQIFLPADVVVADSFAAHAAHTVCAVDAVPQNKMILDAGPATVATWSKALAGCKTLVWNGPVGAFEMQPFDQGTVALAIEAARLTAAGHLRSVAGGGDTLSALGAAGVLDQLSYVSTAGGAFLEWMEGKPLPGVVALEQARVRQTA
jgi:phosphoglycerate kinase